LGIVFSANEPVEPDYLIAKMACVRDLILEAVLAFRHPDDCSPFVLQLFAPPLSPPRGILGVTDLF
jgi:hypothetical protein